MMCSGDRRLREVLDVVPGDSVGVVFSPDQTEPKVGTVRYVGPVGGLDSGHWFGIQLEENESGNSDGRFGHKR